MSRTAQRKRRSVDCVAGIAGLVVLLAASAANAATWPPAFMPVGAEVAPPFGYFDFCQRRADNCPEYSAAQHTGAEIRHGVVASRSGTAVAFWDRVFSLAQDREAPNVAEPYPVTPRVGRVAVAMTPDLWRRVQRVNRQVNSAILPRPDIQVYSRQDFWNPPPTRAARRFGDCEDYVLEKRRLLIAAGLPPEALSIATARLRRANLHAVLLLSTTEGDLVLDNRSAWISLWYRLDYRWERRQVDGGRLWARVNA